MKKILYLAAALFLAVAPSCGHSEGDGHDHGEHEAEGHEGHDHEAEGHDHEAEKGGHASEEILLKPQDAAKFGVKVTQLQPVTFSEVIPVSGQIEASAQDQAVVTATGAGLLRLSPGITVGAKIGAGSPIGTISTKGLQGTEQNAVISAEIAATRREMERVKGMMDQQLATRAEYDAAVAAYNEASARITGAPAHPKALAPIAGTVTQMLAQDGQYVDVGTPIAVVTRNSRNLTLRADVPERYGSQIGSIRTARFRPAYTETTLSLDEMGGRLMSAPQGAAGPRGYLPLYFSFNGGNSAAVAGGYAEVFLIGAQRPGALVVPVQAVTEAQGVNYVYVKIDDEGYEKRPVQLGGNDGLNVEILSGLRQGDNVVTDGVTFVRLAETRAVAPEGHSHHH